MAWSHLSICASTSLSCLAAAAVGPKGVMASTMAAAEGCEGAGGMATREGAGVALGTGVGRLLAAVLPDGCGVCAAAGSRQVDGLEQLSFYASTDA